MTHSHKDVSKASNKPNFSWIAEITKVEITKILWSQFCDLWSHFVIWWSQICDFCDLWSQRVKFVVKLFVRDESQNHKNVIWFCDLWFCDLRFVILWFPQIRDHKILGRTFAFFVWQPLWRGRCQKGHFGLSVVSENTCLRVPRLSPPPPPPPPSPP